MPVQKIAIIGSGIAGLGAAYLTAQKFDIRLYEAENYLGGHSCTVDVPQNDAKAKDGTIPVDIGFIVFNRRNYPNLQRLFDELQVPTADSDMSFGVSHGGISLKYGVRKLGDLSASLANFRYPFFWRLFADIMQFNRRVKNWLRCNEQASVGDICEGLKLGKGFAHYYLLPMAAAIWSAPQSEIADFPATALVEFFDKHGLLTMTRQPQWRTVKGGSREYVNRITARFADKIYLNRAVISVEKNTDEPDKIWVVDKRERQAYDHVIFACHSDQALSMIKNPTAAQSDILRAVRYRPNRVCLHGDTSFMPRRKSAWASWVYAADDAGDNMSSYWMNNLQPLPTETPIITTLNPHRVPDKLYYETDFAHPVFNASAIAAQKRISDIQGVQNMWFCGAWLGYGFHEDGLKSAINIAKRLGVAETW